MRWQRDKITRSQRVESASSFKERTNTNAHILITLLINTRGSRQRELRVGTRDSGSSTKTQKIPLSLFKLNRNQSQSSEWEGVSIAKRSLSLCDSTSYKAPDQLRHPIGLLSNQQKHYDMGVNKFSKQIAKWISVSYVKLWEIFAVDKVLGCQMIYDYFKIIKDRLVIRSWLKNSYRYRKSAN